MSVSVQIKRKTPHKMKAKLGQIRKPSGIAGYDVGWPVDSFYSDRGKIIPTARVAKIQEFGAPSRHGGKRSRGRGAIPARPFFKMANKAYSSELLSRIYILAQNKGFLNVGDVHLLADGHVEAVKKSIADGKFVPNSPSTVRRKGFDNPLTETGQMERDVDYDIAHGI